MEHGYAQQETLQALLQDFGYSDVEGKKDFAGCREWYRPVGPVQ